MASSFDYIQDDLPDFAEKGRFAEDCLYIHNQPSTCMREVRAYAETLAKELARRANLQFPDRGNQIDRISELKNANIIPKLISDNFHTIRISGNIAMHDEYGDKDYATIILEKYYEICVWYAGYCSGRAYERRQYVAPESSLSASNKQYEHIMDSESLANSVLEQKIQQFITAQQDLLTADQEYKSATSSFEEVFEPWQKLRVEFEKLGLDNEATDAKLLLRQEALVKRLRLHVTGERQNASANKILNDICAEADKVREERIIERHEEAEKHCDQDRETQKSVTANYKQAQAKLDTAKKTYEMARASLATETEGKQYLSLHANHDVAMILEPAEPKTELEILSERFDREERGLAYWCGTWSQHKFLCLQLDIRYGSMLALLMAIDTILRDSLAKGTITTNEARSLMEDMKELQDDTKQKKEDAHSLSPDILKELNMAREERRSARIALEEEQKKQGRISRVSYDYERIEICTKENGKEESVISRKLRSLFHH